MFSVVSASGGMDSTALIVHLLERGDTVHAVSFDYGQKHKIELEKLSENILYFKSKGYEIKHSVFDLRTAFSQLDSALTSNLEIPKGFYAEENMKATVVPNRNAIFASIVYGYALSLHNKTKERVEIAMGTHSGDHEIYPDCRPEFFEYLFLAFEIGNWNSENVNKYLPYINGDKESILRDCLICCDRLGLDFDTVLRNTNTSYEPDENGVANGKTGSDVERILAFNAIGRVDPIEYADGWEESLKYALEVEKDYNIKNNVKSI